MIIHDCPQGSPEWRRIRLGVPTASCFHKIVTQKGKLSEQSRTYLAQLCAEWATGMPLDDEGSAFMDRGTELEDEARARYEWDQGVELRRVGFVTTDDGRYGGSPDSLIVGVPKGLEIKCKGLINHVAAAIDTDNAHYVQCQGCMLVCECDEWDRFYYHPTLPPELATLKRDDAFVDALRAALDEFCDRLAAAKERLLSKGWKPPEPSKKCPHTGYPIDSCECGACLDANAEPAF